MEDSQTVTLLLGEERFKVDKKKLIDNSRYFTMLLSTTYSDHRLSEHIINYEIPLNSFQDFINWINNRHNTMKMISGRNNLGRLLILLELSVLFAVDDLTKNITEILEENYLLPEDVLNIWLLAQELSLDILRDLCLDVCLDRFTELPKNLICKLSRQNFLRLVGNSNLRVLKEKETYLFEVAEEWMQINQDTIPLDILKKTGPKVYSSIISCDNSSVNNEFYIHCWDGNKLFELTTFKYPEDIINNKNRIIGMQITARGHHLYLSGGEFGIGTGRFNVNVWRYSLITKKWFLVTRMPCARRHMIAAFLENKLLLAGGVGQHRLKLRSLDIYNVHKGKWVVGQQVPMEFVTPPDYYVFDKKLMIYIRFLKLIPDVYIYISDLDLWYNVEIRVDYQLRLNIRELHETMPVKFKTASCYIDSNKPNEINLRTILINCDNLDYFQEIYKISNFLKINIQNVSQMYFYLKMLNSDLYENNVLICSEDNYVLICLDGSEEELQWHSIPIQNQDKFCSLSSDSSQINVKAIFFDLMDPVNLHAMSATNLDYTT